MCSTNNGSAGSKSSGAYSKEVSKEDVAPIQTYLTQKYGINFTYDEKEYNSILDSDFSHTVYANFVDPNGVKFEAHSNVIYRDNQNVEYSDSYQSTQFNNTIAQQIMAINPNIDHIRISPSYYNEKFISLDQYIAKGECQFISVFLRPDFGDINEGATLELSKSIIATTKISNAFLNFYTYDTYNLKTSYRYKNGEYNLS